MVSMVVEMKHPGLVVFLVEFRNSPYGYSHSQGNYACYQASIGLVAGSCNVSTKGFRLLNQLRAIKS